MAYEGGVFQVLALPAQLVAPHTSTPRGANDFQTLKEISTCVPQREAVNRF